MLQKCQDSAYLPSLILRATLANVYRNSNPIFLYNSHARRPSRIPAYIPVPGKRTSRSKYLLLKDCVWQCNAQPNQPSFAYIGSLIYCLDFWSEAIAAGCPSFFDFSCRRDQLQPWVLIQTIKLIPAKSFSND